MANSYVRSWNIRSFTDPDKVYKVSQRQNGDYACSCPAWIYRRKLCKHIEAVIQQELIEVHQAVREAVPKVQVKVKEEEFEVEEVKFNSRWTI